jgi:hypothetical protein
LPKTGKWGEKEKRREGDLEEGLGQEGFEATNGSLRMTVRADTWCRKQQRPGLCTKDNKEQSWPTVLCGTQPVHPQGGRFTKDRGHLFFPPGTLFGKKKQVDQTLWRVRSAFQK